MPPVIHISGSQALISFLMMVAIFGSIHLLAAAHPQSKFSQAWIGGLGF